VRSERREISTRSDDRERVRDRGHEALAHLAEPGDVVDDLTDPERQAVDVDDHVEVQETEREHAAVLHRLADRVALGAHAGALLALESPREPALLVSLEPVGVLGAVVEIPQDEEAGEHRRQRLDEEQPLPVVQPRDPVEDAHDPAGDRRADRVGDRDRRHEEPDRLRPLARREPEREVQDHAGEEAGLGMPSRKRTA
jgi:hypothetical protein